MDAGTVFNQALFADDSDKTTRPGLNPTGGMSHKTSSTNVIQPFYDAHWLPQLIGPSPRGTPTFWQQSFGQVMPQDSQGVFSDKSYAGPQASFPSASDKHASTSKASLDTISPSANLLAPPAPYQGTKRQISTKASSTTSDLTKRKNWAHHLMHVLPDFAHVLDFEGNIVYASPSVFDLAGYEPDELADRPFVDLIHPEDQLAYTSQFQEVTQQQDAPPLFLYFRMRAKDGSYTLMELTGHARFDATTHHPSLPTEGKRFFGTARPYPSKNASMVDSFVEHKMENERLKARLARLKAECAEAGIDTSSVQGATFPSQQFVDTEMSVSRPDYSADQHNEHSSSSNNVNAGMTVAPQVTTMHSPVLGNATSGGSELPLAQETSAPATSSATLHLPSSSSHASSSKKNRNRRPANDDHSFVCHDCGTTDSPEWRRGPLGPKTLCNACGLRWAKKTKNPKPARHSTAGLPSAQQ